MKLLTPALLLFAATLTAGDAADAEYRTRSAAVKADDADGHYRLALWCEQADLKAAALRHQRAVLVIDPDHRAARRALGYENVRGRWAKGKDLMRAKGFRQHGGAWVTPEEYAVLARDKIAAEQARTARQQGNEALKRTYNRDAAVRSRAMAAIERLPKQHRLRPLSIAARVRHKDVRLRAVEGLGGLESADALPPLYKRAIFDKDEAVRQAAVDAIKGIDAKDKIGPFVQALASPFDSVRIHAAKALGSLGDERAVGPLVARYQVVGGSGQSVYISQVNQISFVQDFDVEVAQTSFIADPVIGVIQDGLTLNFRALANTGTYDVYEAPGYADALGKLTGKDFGTNPKAWLKWYRAEQRAKRKQARRSAAAEADSE